MAATTSARTIRRSLRMAGELDFRIATVQQWALRPRTQVGQPQKWGAFSYDAERRMHLDERGRKLFRDPFVPTREAPRPADLDLNYGLETFAPGHLAPDRLDALLEVLRSRADADAGAAAQLASNRLITFRGIMTKLCTMLYDDRDGFELNAQMLGETIFLEQYCSQDKYLRQVAEMENPTRRRNTYQGYSFESYCTVEADRTDRNRSTSLARDRSCSPVRNAPRTDSRRRQPPLGWSGDVNPNEQWCVLMRSKLGDNRIIIGGEVDCVNSANELVELKTTMELASSRDRMFFEKKLVRFYFQSFLLGVPNIYVGYKSRRGTVRWGEMFRTLELPRLVRGHPHAWDPHACLSLASAFLAHLHHVLDADRDAQRHAPDGQAARAGRVFRISRAPGGPAVHITALPQDEVDRMNIEAGSRQPAEGGEPQRVGILPEWYVDWAAARGPNRSS